jgi:flavin reductase (DIM6/NTAB) family NADH-FMN oxidoreductase RutF
MRATDPAKAYRMLESGPVVMVVTHDGERPNVMTMGFHMMVQHAPPLIGAVIGPWDHSYAALRDTGECVIAVPGADLAGTLVDIGNCRGAQVDKFDRFDLATQPAARVSAPLLGDCLYNLECVVHDDSLVERYSLFVLEAIAAWVNDDRAERRCLHHQGDGTFSADGERIDLRARMTLWKQFQVDL